MRAENINDKDAEIDEVEAALAWHNGDARAAVVTLIEDCRHLRQQLAIAEIGLSLGFTRGWTPAPNRE